MGHPVLILNTIGCKSGRQRKAPLFFFQEGERIVLVASRGGTTKNPAWYHNICAKTECAVQVNGLERTMVAHVANQTELDEYWQKVTVMLPTWEEIQAKSIRRFPLVILDPKRREIQDDLSWQPE
jgi:deazaflavin-dependent oxidoreductase (nitroreductase family)